MFFLVLAPSTAWALTSNGMVALAFSVVFNSVGKYALTAFCNKHVSVVVLTVWQGSTTVALALIGRHCITECV